MNRDACRIESSTLEQHIDLVGSQLSQRLLVLAHLRLANAREVRCRAARVLKRMNDGGPCTFQQTELLGDVRNADLHAGEISRQEHMLVRVC